MSREQLQAIAHDVAARISTNAPNRGATFALLVFDLLERGDIEMVSDRQLDDLFASLVQWLLENVEAAGPRFSAEDRQFVGGTLLGIAELLGVKP